MQYPENVIRVMHSQIVNLRHVVNHHYKNRHDGRGNQSVRNWIAALRRTDRASGYSEAVALVKSKTENKGA